MKKNDIGKQKVDEEMDATLGRTSVGMTRVSPIVLAHHTIR